MSELKLKLDPGFTIQAIYTGMHKLLLQAKLCHYKTRKFSAHDAFGRAYDGLVTLTDSITEQLIGYSGTDPDAFTIGTIMAIDVAELGTGIISFAEKLEHFAEDKEYCNIENLAQELSGLGAQIKYLSRFP